MNPDKEAEILDRLAGIHQATKSFDSWGEWSEEPERGGVKLHYRAPLKIEGTLGGGVSVHLITPQSAWDGEVYGQIEILRPGVRTAWRINAVEWRPDRPHRNPSDAPSDLRFRELSDRVHPFGLNRRLGLAVFAQQRIGIAQDFPRAIATFEDYLSLCAEVWKCPDVTDIAPPTWLKKLL